MKVRRRPISQVLALLISISLLGLIGAIDYTTGPQVDVIPLYLLPLGIVTWICGRRPGLIMAGTCTAVWLAAVLLSDQMNADSLVPYWNALATWAGFSVVALLVDARRQLGKRVEEMVEEKTVALTAEIAERRRAEEAVHRLAAQLSAAEEEQRRQLARDIHDTLGQTLTVLKLNLQGLRGNDAHNGAGRDPHPDRLRDSVQLIENMIQQTRSMTFELYPAMLDDLGLVPTIRRYCDQVQGDAGIQISVSEVGGGRALPGHVSAYLYRAVKELVNNARKHGDPREIVITFHWRELPRCGLRVVVDDDGRGFDVAQGTIPASQGGLGLPSIRERIASLGGNTHLESALGKGTRVIIELPGEVEQSDRNDP